MAVHTSATTHNKKAFSPEDQQMEPSILDLLSKRWPDAFHNVRPTARDGHSVRGTKSRFTDTAPLAGAVTTNIMGAIEPSVP
jgi:hypothetical protein